MSWAKAENQARSVVRELQKSGDIQSLGTANNYQSALTNIARELKNDYREQRDAGTLDKNDTSNRDLRTITEQRAIDILERRAQCVGQSQLNSERQSLQLVMHKNGALDASQKLPVIRSELDSALKSRAYTADQTERIAQRQTPQNALATRIAAASGARAHELHTLRRADERPADPRAARAEKFQGLGGVRYTVVGKGGLCREIAIPRELSKQLEKQRSEPRRVTDRGIYYQSVYKIGGGNAWSASFSRASKRETGWSNGGHGLRHSYAQERMKALQRSMPYVDALTVVSQEMGHFRPDITEVYLR